MMIIDRASSAPRPVDPDAWPPEGVGVWPPPGVEPVDITELYTKMATRGFEYGPAFRGLRSVWRGEGEIFADVELDTGLTGPGEPFLLHPALLDSALHAALTLFPDESDGTPLPFAWRGVKVLQAGVRAARVRVSPSGRHGMSILLMDAVGAPVASIEALAVRPARTDQLGAAQGGRLLRLNWKALARPVVDSSAGLAFLGLDHLGLTGTMEKAGRPLASFSSLARLDASLRAGNPAPSAVLVSVASVDLDAVAVEAATQRILALIQAWLADDRLAASRLVVVTRKAVAARAGEDVAGLAGAAVWGLVRTAQAEHPGRFALADLDETEASARALGSAVATEEPQLALRRGGLFRPRLDRCAGSGTARHWNPEGTVLLTGGLGALGTLVARHLVVKHGIRHLVLLSRRGGDTPGAGELIESLAGLGAEATVVACDAADRSALAEVVGAIPAEHPLTAVLHVAGILDDGTITSLTPRRLQRVLRPKVDAAINLHQLTKDRPDCDLILFSSVAGVLGNAGQASYAAANAFLDGLAQHRRATGLPGHSLAWGPWEDADGMAGTLSAADVTRIKRLGLAPFSAAQGLALLDAARGRDEAVLVPVRLNEAALRSRAESLPELMLDLAAPVAASSSSSDGGVDSAADLREQLASAGSAEERLQLVLDRVRAESATVLGHDGPGEVLPDREFIAAGFDSLTTLELSRRLATVTGLKLAPTIIFDHPTPAGLAGEIARLLG
jgi:NADP-dependent 3-hydroxy acid dehydrogenase YdfG